MLGYRKKWEGGNIEVYILKTTPLEYWLQIWVLRIHSDANTNGVWIVKKAGVSGD